MNKYVERLTKEWLQYGRIIIAVDYDSTISPWGKFNNEEDIKKCWKLLRQCEEVGCYIVVHTSCSEDRYDEILTTFLQIGINVHSINKNPFELPYGHNTKPYFNILLDDRAGFIEAMDILEAAMYATIGARKPIYDDVA